MMVAHAQQKGVQNGTNNSRNSCLNFLERFTSDATAPFFFHSHEFVAKVQ